MSTAKASIAVLPPPIGEYLLDSEEILRQPTAQTAPVTALADLPVLPLGLGEVAAAAIGEGERPQPSQTQREAHAQAREDGYREGHVAGMEVGKKEWHRRVERLIRIAEALENAKVEIGARVGEEAAAIAFAAVVKILGHRQASRAAIAEVVESIRNTAPSAEPLVVRVHPDDYEVLLAEPVMIELEDQRGVIRLVEDPRVVLGGCFVEGTRGTLDARLETQVERLRSLLLDVRKAEDLEDRAP